MTNKVKVICAIILIALTAVALVLATPPLRQGVWRFYENIIYDNQSHQVPCNQLPSKSQVEQVMLEHEGVVNKIKAINPGISNIVISEPSNCFGKADITILYGSHADRVKIENIINGPLFFGVPYNLLNY